MPIKVEAYVADGKKLWAVCWGSLRLSSGFSTEEKADSDMITNMDLYTAMISRSN